MTERVSLKLSWKNYQESAERANRDEVWKDEMWVSESWYKMNRFFFNYL